MKVFLTGATGFIGGHLASALLDAGHEIYALVRRDSEPKLPAALRARRGFWPVEGDLLDPGSVCRAARGCAAAIHLVGIIREWGRDQTFENVHVAGSRNLAEAAKKCGMGRILYMSALGTKYGAQSIYHRTKYEGESLIRFSGIPSVIFRPSLIFGRGDGFTLLESRLIRPFLPVVVPGRGETLLQPVAIEDIVQGLVKALTSDSALGEIYEIGGPGRFSLEKMIDMIAEAKGVSSHIKLHVPLGLLRPITAILQRFRSFPVGMEQLVMLAEDSICNPRAYYEEFEIKPREFAVEAIRQILIEEAAAV